jgi:hypothetical protein
MALITFFVVSMLDFGFVLLIIIIAIAGKFKGPLILKQM